MKLVACFALLNCAVNALLFERVNVPPSWTLSSREPHPDQLLSLELMLNQHRQDDLLARLDEVSDPDHADYGKHLSAQQLQEFTQPSNETISIVRTWLEGQQDIQSAEWNPTQSFVTVILPLRVAEAMLESKFAYYKHTSDMELLRTTQVSLPEHLHGHIDAIGGTTYFHTLQAQGSHVLSRNLLRMAKQQGTAVCPTGKCSAAVEKLCDPQSLTPACIKAFYNVNYVPKVPQKQYFGITGYLSQYANYKDLAKYQKLYSQSTTGANFSVVSVNKGLNSQVLSDAGLEANLDTQLGSSMTFPIKNTFYTTKGSPSQFTPDLNTPENTNEPYAVLLNYLLTLQTPPSVLTTSYGDDEQTVPASLAKKVCNLYAQLGSRGTTAVHSSGDGGCTGSGIDGYCQKNDAAKTTRFLPVFPASCPYVLAVGSTQASSSQGLAQEVVAPYSGGGFSEIFTRPSWQASMFANYFKVSGVDKTYKGLFNPNGRGFPDVALLGSFYADVVSGYEGTAYGTSASAPIIASFVALLNDKRLANGQPLMGYITPWIYKVGKKAFKAIETGDNRGCSFNPTCTPSNCKLKGKPLLGFPAKGVWSPTVGFGSPDVTKLLALA